MKPKTLLILSAVTILLAAFVYFVERDLPSTDEKKDLETKVLAFDADDVTAVTLRADGREVRLERAASVSDDETDDADDAESAGGTGSFEEDEWRLAEPLRARADTASVESLLADLLALRSERALDEVNEDAAGLASPRAVVVLATDDGEVTLEVGADVPLSEDALVRVSGETGGTDAAGRVVQTGFGESLRDRVAQEAGDWRDPRLFFARRADVESLAWTGPDGTRAVLQRDGDGDNFLLTEPVTDRADRGRVGGLLSSLTSLEAERFVDGSGSEDEASFTPEARLEVTIAGSDEPWVLELADLDSDEPLARVTGTGEAVPGTGETVPGTGETESTSQTVRIAGGPVTDALGGPADRWRSTAWTHLQVFQIDEAVIDQAGEELLAIRRHEQDWLRTTGTAARVAENAEGEVAGDEVPYTAASNVLYPLAEAKAERLVSPPETAALDLSEPTLTVTLVTDDGEETLRLYGRIEEPRNEEQALFAARTDGRDVVLLLPAETVEELLDAVESLREAEPVPSDASLDVSGEPDP